MVDKIGLYTAPIGMKPLQQPVKEAAGAADVSRSFGDLLNQAMNQLSSQEKAVETLNGQFVRGELSDVHQLMIQAEKLSLGLDLTVQVRNKVIEAYQDIMRMQI